MHILGICGSLRRASYNRGLLRAALDLLPHEPGRPTRLEIADVGDLPLMDEDLEARGWPAPVAALRERAYAADGLLFACPEYNYGVAAPMKNAVDWISRPEGAGGNKPRPGPRNAFLDKPCAIIGASPGMGGTIRAQLQLRQSLQLNRALVMPGPELFVAGAREKFDAQGNLTDRTSRDLLAQVLAAFAEWVRRTAPQGTARPPIPQEAGGPRDAPEGGADELEEGLEESFPASDPPSATQPNR